jgi:hypothetical protein
VTYQVEKSLEKIDADKDKTSDGERERGREVQITKVYIFKVW